MRKQFAYLVFSFFMPFLVKAQSNASTQIVQDVFQDISATGSMGGRTFTGVEFHTKDATVGSPYLYSKWVKGSAVNNNDSVVANPSYLFNYNKMNGTLLVTQDQKIYIEVDQSALKSFTFTDESGNHKYTRLSAIKPNLFFLAIAEGSKYSAYKFTKTHFKKADYQTDGIVEHGNNYDEYADESTYYIVDNKTNKSTPIELKKKSIKNVIGTEKEKVDKYFNAHKEDTVDDDFLKGLVESLNSGQ